MSLVSPFSRRLYLRIWLAVVGGVLVFAFAVGFAWRWAADQTQQQPPTREIVLTDPQGRTLVDGVGERQRLDPSEGIHYRIQSSDGKVYEMRMSPRTPHVRPDERGPAAWFRPPFGFLWILGLVGIAVTVGVFPIIRRLLQRLETLQSSVQRFGEGDLSVRVAEQGHDEVAALARQFNAAAERIETLVQSHKSLLANASHELRSPLTRIRMGLELMGNGAPSPAFRAEIERNIAELDQLVDEILLASRLDAGAADVGTIEPVDLVGLAVEECVRVDAELQTAVTSEGGRGARRLQAAAPRRAQPAGERAPLQPGRNHPAHRPRRRRRRAARVRPRPRRAARAARAHLRALLPPARRQRTRGRRGPGAGAGALHRTAPWRQRALRGTAGRRARRLLRAGSAASEMRAPGA